MELQSDNIGQILSVVEQMKGVIFSMSLYKEKREKLIEKVKFYENRIAKDTEKKKKLLDKLKELTV